MTGSEVADLQDLIENLIKRNNEQQAAETQVAIARGKLAAFLWAQQNQKGDPKCDIKQNR